jgi:hypothetical protein
MNKLLFKPQKVIKTLLFILFIFSNLFHYSCSGEKDKNDLSRLNLKGRIKVLKESQYLVDANGGEVNKGDLSMISISYFNEIGNLVEKRFYASNGDLWFRHVYKYNSRNNCIEEIRHDPESKISSRTIMEYDKKGNKKTRVSTYNQYNELSSKEVYKYDDKGNNIETAWHNAKSNLIRKSAFKYDNKDNLIQMISYDAGGKLSDKVTYTYDEYGNMVTSVNYAADDVVKNKSGFKYAEFGKQDNWIKRVEYNNGIPNGIIEREIQYY